MRCAGVAIALALVATACGAAVARPVATLSPPVSPTPSTAPTAGPVVGDRACGAWSGSASAFTSAVTDAYGPLRNCALVGQVWVVTTLGTVGGRGAIGVDVCADASCLDAGVDHPFSNWQFYPAPYAGGVTLLGHPQPDVLLVSNGGHEVEFNLNSRSWTLER